MIQASGYTEPDYDEEEFNQKADRIQQRVRDHIGEHTLVRFEAYEKDADGLPVDNLDERVIQGRAQFMKVNAVKGYGHWDYVSPIQKNPTWMQVCVLANEMLLKTDDRQHVHLEGLELFSYDGKLWQIVFDMGS